MAYEVVMPRLGWSMEEGILVDAPVRRLNGAHTPIPYSPPLEKAVVPDAKAVVQAIRDLLAG